MRVLCDEHLPAHSVSKPMHTDQFHIALGDPHFGWLPIAIQLAGHVHQYEASNVLNNPLNELADVAAALASTATVNESVHIWLEPASVHLQFAALDEAGTVEVSLFDEELRSRFASASVPRATVLSVLIEALETLQTRMPRTGVMDGWRAEFPTATLREAKAGQASAERDVGFLPPWRPLEDIDRIREEVLIELGRQHELSGVRFSLRGINEAADEFLIELHTGPHAFAVLCLDWNGKARKALPAMLYASFDEWRTVRMLPDSRKTESD